MNILLLVAHEREDFSTHAFIKLHAMLAIIFLGIGIHRAEIRYQ